jgi:hypothetical protein
LAACGRVGYCRAVLRRGIAFLALLAVLAAPAVTSTRLFCRYTGQELFGCAESGVPQSAHIRADDCCDKRTFRALEAVRPASDAARAVPQIAAIGIASVVIAIALSPAAPAGQRSPVRSVGPPAFLAHRALLI